ncbi:hypothetical protein Pst134EB_025087 [Puccinia striiformis f. sp. tritici]|nr:hypothetical protein Pst134EB_025087 [Puccinia striiformis f. sp. tritici]
MLLPQCSIVDGGNSELAHEAMESRSIPYSHPEPLSEAPSLVDRSSHQRLSWQESLTVTGPASFPLDSQGRNRSTGKRQRELDAEQTGSKFPREAPQDGHSWPPPGAERLQLFKPMAISPAEIHFPMTRDLNLANPLSRGSAFAQYGHGQHMAHRSSLPIISLGQDHGLNSQYKAREFVQPDHTRISTSIRGVSDEQRDKIGWKGKAPVSPSAFVPATNNPKDNLASGKLQTPVIPSEVLASHNGKKRQLVQSVQRDPTRISASIPVVNELQRNKQARKEKTPISPPVSLPATDNPKDNLVAAKFRTPGPPSDMPASHNGKKRQRDEKMKKPVVTPPSVPIVGSEPKRNLEPEVWKRVPVFLPFLMPASENVIGDRRTEHMKTPFISPSLMSASNNSRQGVQVGRLPTSGTGIPPAVAPPRDRLEKAQKPVTLQPSPVSPNAKEELIYDTKMKIPVVPPHFSERNDRRIDGQKSNPPVVATDYKPTSNDEKKPQEEKKLKTPLITSFFKPVNTFPSKKLKAEAVQPSTFPSISTHTTDVFKKEQWDVKLKTPVFSSGTSDNTRDLKAEKTQLPVITPVSGAFGDLTKGDKAEKLKTSVIPPVAPISRKDLDDQKLKTAVVMSQASRQASHLAHKASEFENQSTNSHSSIALVRIADVKSNYSHQALSWIPEAVNIRAARGTQTLALRFLRSIKNIRARGMLMKMHYASRIMVPFTYDLISKDWSKGNWLRVKRLWKRFWMRWDESINNATEEETLRTFLWISDYISETTIPELSTLPRSENANRRSTTHLNNKQVALLKNMSIGDPKIFQMKPAYVISASDQVFESFLHDSSRIGFFNLDQSALSQLHTFVLGTLNDIAGKILSACPEEDIDQSTNMPKVADENDKAESGLYPVGNARSLIGGHSKRKINCFYPLDPLLKDLTAEVFETEQNQKEFLFQPERIRNFFVQIKLYLD